MKYLEQYMPSEMLTHRLLEKRANAAPDSLFFTFLDEQWTLGHFNARANRIARNLQALGIGRGTHVAVVMDTSSDSVLLWLALSKLGAVDVPINTAYHGALLSQIIATSRATACVFDARFAAIMRDATCDFSGFDTVIQRGGALESPALSFASLHRANEEQNLDAHLGHGETTSIIFTSGTTGPSKGVMLSHHYVVAYGLMYAEINGLKDDDVVYNFLPYFHIAAKFLTIATLACGGRMRLQEKLSISNFWSEVRAHGVTNFVGVGGICNMLISRPPAPEDREMTIRTIYAVPDPADIHVELENRFGCKITTVYGSTEAGLPLFRGVDDAYCPGSCGRMSPYYDVQIVDDDDNPVAAGVTGHFVVRPKRPYLVGSGYIGMPERTVEAWRNLWLHTGDRGHVDADGWHFFDDRASDSLRRKGENISSFEIELLVAKHPAVAEAIAVPAPAEIGEDDVRVLVILREGAVLDHVGLLRHCAETMPYFMVPRYYDIVSDVPRTPTAKVEKYKIRKEGLTEATWDREAHGWTVTRIGLTKREIA